MPIIHHTFMIISLITTIIIIIYSQYSSYIPIVYHHDYYHDPLDISRNFRLMCDGPPPKGVPPPRDSMKRRMACSALLPIC